MTKTIVVVVGMSGGVDSTVSAYILQKQGYRVLGITMKIWPDEGNPKESKKNGCYGPGEIHDIQEAQIACERLAIPHYVVDLTREYASSVMENFFDEYQSGRTPNPCILCNPLIKFGALLAKARLSGIQFDRFATGHYARVSFNASQDRYALKKGVDQKKDQSYFLYQLKQSQLEQTIFPLGELNKEDVRTLAREVGFADFAEKPESQDFFDGGAYQHLFESSKLQKGNILDLQGKILGRHNGIINFTIGQRKGLNIGGSEEPLYVLEKDALSNNIVVGPKQYLAVDRLIAFNVNWIA
ncbi:MAG: tRNA 2-thiouridine(34) synthase MnmA, partial [Anaerolineales bacterium]|nr:tRNA 2-thiouridine(34) synthase MnmA [Anaerolineales bacterium]